MNILQKAEEQKISHFNSDHKFKWCGHDLPALQQVDCATKAEPPNCQTAEGLKGFGQDHSGDEYCDRPDPQELLRTRATRDARDGSRGVKVRVKKSVYIYLYNTQTCRVCRGVAPHLNSPCISLNTRIKVDKIQPKCLSSNIRRPNQTSYAYLPIHLCS